MSQQRWFGSVQGFSFICFSWLIYEDLKFFPSSKRKTKRNSKSVGNFKPTKIKTSNMERKESQYKTPIELPVLYTPYTHLLLSAHTLSSADICMLKRADVSERRVRKCERRETWWVRTPCLFLHGERAVIAEFLWMKYGVQFLRAG